MLETRNVFIDTQYFVKAGLNFETAALKSFRRLCEERELLHITTSVVDREVEGKINHAIKEALSSLQTFKRKARILEFIDDEKIRTLFCDINDEDVCNKASAVYQEFIKLCKTEYIEASSINPEELLSLYFDQKPPFSDGKKKSEFPDAISLLSLKSYLTSEEKIYIISDDGDMKSFCDANEQFLSIDSLDKMLDLYNLHTNIRTSTVKDYFEIHKELLTKRIGDYLEECEVYNNSTWENSEPDSFTVTNVGEIHPSIVCITDEECQVTFDVDVDFEVSVTGPDYINGIYDREDGRVYTFDTTTRVTSVTKTFTVEVGLSYEFSNGNLENVEVEELFIPGVSGGIEVDIEENGDDWHYK